MSNKRAELICTLKHPGPDSVVAGIEKAQAESHPGAGCFYVGITQVKPKRRERDLVEVTVSQDMHCGLNNSLAHRIVVATLYKPMLNQGGTKASLLSRSAKLLAERINWIG